MFPHPLMTFRTVLAGLAALTIDRTHLRDLPPPQHISWSPVRIHGLARPALSVTGPTPLTWVMYALPGSRLRAWCAVRHRTAGASATFTLAASSSTASRSRSIAVAAGDGWREHRLDLGELSGEVTVTLAVASAQRDCDAVWGDPALQRHKRVADLARAAIQALRILGVRALLHRASVSGGGEDALERYRQWLESQHRTRDAQPPPLLEGPLVTILTPVFNTDAFWLRRCIGSVQGQSYRSWELVLSDDGSTDPRTLRVLAEAARDPRIQVIRAVANGGIVTASNTGLGAARGEFIGFLDHDDELAPAALAEVMARVAAQPELDVVYSDEDKIDPSGARSQPHFKPDWSPELLYSCMYISHFTVMRRQVVVEAGGFRDGHDGAQDYDLMLRVAERTQRIAHVPKVLYSWRMAPGSVASSQLAKPWAIRAAQRALESSVQRTGMKAVVEPTAAAGHFRVRHAVAGAPVLSVLVLVPDAGADGTLVRLLRALAKTTAGHTLDIVLGHDAARSGVPPAIAAVGSLRCRIVAHEPGHGSTTRLNALARAASGDHLLLLNHDAEPFESGWLDALLEFSQQPPIGAVGATLLRRDGTIAHAGVVTGVGALAAYAFNGEPEWTRGHLSNALDVRNCAAVGGGCLLTRREVFESVGGLDERLGARAAEIDYGLAVRCAGLRVVVTPHARLRAGAGIAAIDGIGEPETLRLRERWGARLDEDPYYNPNFGRRDAGFRLPPVFPTDLST